MGFIESSSAGELDAQTDMPDPDPIDKIDHELEIELGPEDAPEGLQGGRFKPNPKPFQGRGGVET